MCIVKSTLSFLSKFQLAAAGHAVGTNSHTSYWNQAEDKFEQIEKNSVQGLGDLTVTKEEVRSCLYA